MTTQANKENVRGWWGGGRNRALQNMDLASRRGGGAREGVGWEDSHENAVAKNSRRKEPLIRS